MCGWFSTMDQTSPFPVTISARWWSRGILDGDCDGIEFDIWLWYIFLDIIYQRVVWDIRRPRPMARVSASEENETRNLSELLHTVNASFTSTAFGRPEACPWKARPCFGLLLLLLQKVTLGTSSAKSQCPYCVWRLQALTSEGWAMLRTPSLGAPEGDVRH